MNLWRRGICILFVLEIVAVLMGDKLFIKAEETSQVTYVYYSGVLERNDTVSAENYLNQISFDRNVDVTVKLELDTEKCTSESGGHVQLALTKDEAHSHWMDDIALYDNVQNTYEETCSLYAGYYTFEMHLIRDEDAHVPFKVTLAITNNDTLPDIDPEATIWFKWGWDAITVHKGNKNLKIDLFWRLGISSWTKMSRTDLVYQSSNEKIATVDSYGKITIKKTGTVRVTAQLPNGETAVSKLKVISR